MNRQKTTLLWMRRDLRLSDNVALVKACARGGPVIPVFIHDGTVAKLGAAIKWRLGASLLSLSGALTKSGSSLILRQGDALKVLQNLVRQTGSDAVYWSRAYDPVSVARDTEIKATLKSEGIEAKSFGGHLLFEPWAVTTKTGGFYKVYTPFWNCVRQRSLEPEVPAPVHIQPPSNWPESDDLTQWCMGQAMKRGLDVMPRFVRVGEGAAQQRLADFTRTRVANYVQNRDFPSKDGTSNLSDSLAVGEISPLQCWHAGQRALQEGKAGAEVFLKEIVWREFAYHLMHHTPHILTDNWKPGWDKFPWNRQETAQVLAWKQGRTGIPFVDAAMRELYVTGRMHNRGRMIVASYLTKHLMTDWRIGQRWFEDCLIDWDPASNAMGWQWSAGSGPDATPYFRVFNPVSQLDKFDKDREYVDRWIAERQSKPHPDALSFFDAVPESWDLDPAAPYPSPIVSPEQGRKNALSAYENKGF